MYMTIHVKMMANFHTVIYNNLHIDICLGFKRCTILNWNYINVYVILQVHVIRMLSEKVTKRKLRIESTLTFHCICSFIVSAAR